MALRIAYLQIDKAAIIVTEMRHHPLHAFRAVQPESVLIDSVSYALCRSAGRIGRQRHTRMETIADDDDAIVRAALANIDYRWRDMGNLQ